MGLPEYYMACNEESGHRYNCGYGAGADCTCGVIPFCFYEGCEAFGGDHENGCSECGVKEAWAVGRERGLGGC